MFSYRRRVGLAARRKVKGLTQEALAELLGVSVNTISSWECGESTPTPRIRPCLAGVLGVTEAGLDALLFPVDRPAIPSHAIPDGFNHRDSLIRSAGHVARPTRVVIPGLLQTRPYALAVERGMPRVTEEWVERRVEFRLRQQELLERDGEREPLQLTAVLNENVLRGRPGGSSEVMLGQLEHLDQMATRPNVEIRVVTEESGQFWATEFELLYRTVADSGSIEPEPFLAITFLPGGFDYHELLVESFAVLLSDLLDVALTREESHQFIHEQMERYR